MTFNLQENSNNPFFYVEDLTDENKHLGCTICKSPLENPVTTPCCRYMACLNCLKSPIEQKKECPICSSECELENISTNTPIFITRQLDNLKVLCTRCNNGELIKRVNFEDHLENSCRTECELKCGEMLTKSEIQLHNDICRKYPVECSAKDVGCHWNGIREEKQEHEKNCHFIALESILTLLLKKIALLEDQVDILNQNLKL